MKKFYVKKEDLNSEELRTGRVSYGRIITRYITDLVICNNIQELDNSIWENSDNLYNEETEEYEEIYQFYLCNLTEYEKEELLECGIILSYSNLLDLDVLCVEHCGTSWSYVMTDVEWTENFDEC